MFRPVECWSQPEMTDIMISIETDEMARQRLRCPYDAGVVEIIKSLDWSMRSFERETKAWLIQDVAVEQLTEKLTKAGHRVMSGDTPPPPTPRAIHPSGDESLGGFFALGKTERLEAEITAQALLDSIPKARQGAVFRAMGKILFPDIYTGKR